MVQNNINVPVGIIRLARIVRYNVSTGKAKVKLANTAETIMEARDIEIYIPASFYSSNGMFIGGLVQENTPITITRGEGGTWQFVSFLMTNPLTNPTLVQNQLLIQSTNLSKITLDTSNNINIGSDNDKLHMYVNNNDVNDTLISSTFNSTYNFTEASRSTTGVVKRELKKIDIPSYLKLESDDYLSRLYTISLDPTVTKASASSSQSKNPPFTEQRSMVYEFGYSYNIQDDITEGLLYKKDGSNSTVANTSSTTDRRASRVDTLSLSLVAPNYLMETVKGTVIDIFGNILDINRNPIPIGAKDLTLRPNKGESIPFDAFNKIKAAERRSIAYHFEINARKDLSASSQNEGLLDILDIDSSEDYARKRSRFFFDVDKEGQFKLNIPSSSETGNVSLLTRYENYSTYGSEENGNPNKLIFREDNLDIFLDSFAIDEIDVMDGSVVATPNDRLTLSPIKKGMPFHSILNSLQTFQTGYAEQFLNFPYNDAAGLTTIPTIDNVVSSTINVSGTNANAGGRSGSVHMDGSLDLSIGANTVDRQSLWMDLAGGMIANVGRDNNNMSMGISLDGDMFVQIGGNGVATDSRFSKSNNAYRAGSLDIRVLNDGFTVSIIRIDKNGVTIATPNTFTVQARDITLNAEANLVLKGDNVYIQDRLVTKYPITSI